MQKSFRSFSIGVLNLLANAGVFIPYFFCLMLYNIHKTEPIFVLPFLMLYTFRCIGMLLTAQIKRSAIKMMNVSSIFGVLGSISMLFADKIFFGILGGILLGLASSWIWPYFLTIRSRGKLSNEFSMTKQSWLYSLIAMILLLVVSFVAMKYKAMAIAFLLLAILFLFAWFGGVFLKNEIDFYREDDFKASFIHPSRLILNLVYLTILVVLMFSIRYSRLKTTSHSLDLIMCLLAAVILGTLIYVQLGIHKKIFPLSLGALNRGFVMNFLLLYSTFDSTLRFNFEATVWIFVIYLLGFEIGPMLLKKFPQYRYPTLFVGMLLTLFNFVPLYFLGLFLAAVFVGADNTLLNRSLYSSPNLDGERAFLVKYQLSSIGNISQQLIYMSLVYLLSYFLNLNVLSFFNPTVHGATYTTLTIVHTVITIGILLISMITYHFVKKLPLTDE